MLNYQRVPTGIEGQLNVVGASKQIGSEGESAGDTQSHWGSPTLWI